MSDDDEESADGPPLFEASSGRLQIVFDHDRNRDLLADWLGEFYEVEAPAEPTVEPRPDLRLVDAVAFARHQDTLQRWKREEKPVFAPVLLVSEEPVSEQFDPGEWQTIDGLYVVDDVVSMPVEKAVLHRRLENLLERRTLSQTLEEKYRRSKKRFSSLFATLPDPALVTDERGVIQYANDALCTVCGRDRDAVVGVPLTSFDCFESDAPARLAECIDAAVAGEPVDVGEVELSPPDGDRIVVEPNATAATVDDENVVTLVLRDVTRRVDRTAALAESERRFQQMASHVDEIIWMVDSTGDLLYISDGYEELTGRDLDALSEGPLEVALDHVHPDDSGRIERGFREMFAEVQAGEPAPEYEFEYRLVRDDGSIRWVQTDAYPVTGHNGGSTRIVGLLVDITDRKQREHALEQQNDRLEDFAGIVSHDLRNPLQVIDARLDMLDPPADEREHVAAIGRAADRMQRMIDDLLSLAQEGKAVSETEAVELGTVARLAWRSVDAPDASMTVDGELVVEADPERLQQLLENLFRNSVEHGSDDGVGAGEAAGTDTDDGLGTGADVSIEVGPLPDGFYVADDGPGIPEDRRDRVFEQGYSTQDNGTGLGLNIVADIAAAHDWTIDVTESRDGGAQFEVAGVETD